MIPFAVKLAAQMAEARDEISKLTAERDALAQEVDQVSCARTDGILRESDLQCRLNMVTAERDALLAAQMTEEKAREILVGADIEILEHGLYRGDVEWLAGRTTVWLNAYFTTDQLEAIAYWMEYKGGGK